MMNERDVLGRFHGLGRKTLMIWIERGWLAPERGRHGYRFREIDLARIRLIREFTREMALDDNALDVVLPLLDQVHGLRHRLRCLAEAVSAEPAEVRRRIAAELEARAGRR
jgi:chaperone modulatory protein CbpM